MAGKSDIETMGVTVVAVGLAFIAGGIMLNMIQPDMAARGRALYAKRFGF